MVSAVPKKSGQELGMSPHLRPSMKGGKRPQGQPGYCCPLDSCFMLKGG